MIQKLELKHLASYLPYGLKVIYTHTREIGNIKNLYDIEYYNDIKISINWLDGEHIWMFKPILRPLSDLTKEIDVNGEKFVPLQYLSININWHSLEQWKCDHKLMNIEEYNNLLSWHFDVFGLIEQDLAIDINTLNNG